MVQEMTEEAYGAFFNVPPKNKGQKLIFFGWFKSEPMTRKSSENNFESPQFYHYRQNFHHMMKKMGYNLGKRSGLNFGKGRRVLLWSFVPKGKALDYYHKTRRGFGYVSTPVPLNSKSKESPCHDHSSGTSSWEPDVSIGAIINSLLANMVSTSHLKDEDEEMIQLDIIPGSNTWTLFGTYALKSVSHPLRINWPRLIWEMRLTSSSFL